MGDGLVLFAEPVSQRELIFYALKDTKVGAATIEELGEVLSATIERGVFYLALNKTEKDKEMLKVMAFEDCQNHFFTMTLSEIKLGIENGYRGTYGEVRGMAPRDIYNWIIAFRNSEVRKDAVKQISESSVAPQRVATLDDLRQIVDGMLEYSWKSFLDGYVNDFGNVVYNFLSERCGFLRVTDEQMEKYKDMGKRILIREHAPEKHFGNDLKMKEAMNITLDIKAGQTSRIEFEAKRIALGYFYNELQDQGKTVFDLFK